MKTDYLSILGNNCCIRILLFTVLIFASLINSFYASIVFAQEECEVKLQSLFIEYQNRNHEEVIRMAREVIESPRCLPEQMLEAQMFQGASYYCKPDTESAEVIFEAVIKSDSSYNCVPANFGPPGEDICRFFYRVKAKLFVPLDITSEPSGDSVYIDGKPVGVTPFRNERILAGETHEIVLKQKCYKEIREKIFIEKGEPKRVHRKMEKLFCPIQISSEPDDLWILIDGNIKGRTPWTDSVSCGDRHRIYFNKDNYCDTAVVAECSDAKTIDIFVALRIKKKGPSIVYPIISTMLTAGAGGSILYFQEEAESAHDRYIVSLTLDDINKNWNDCERNVSWRDRSIWATVTLSGFCAYYWLRYLWPGPEGGRCDLQQAPGDSKKVEIGLIQRNGQVQLVISKRF